MSAKIGTHNLTAVQGDTFYESCIVKDSNSVPVDLSVYTKAKMQVKENEFANAVLTFTNTGSTYNIDISNLAAGQIIMSATSINIDPFAYIYDLQLSNSETIETVFGGRFIILSQVTT